MGISDWSSDVCSSDLDPARTSLGITYAIPLRMYLSEPRQAMPRNPPYPGTASVYETAMETAPRSSAERKASNCLRDVRWSRSMDDIFGRVPGEAAVTPTDTGWPELLRP